MEKVFTTTKAAKLLAILVAIMTFMTLSPCLVNAETLPSGDGTGSLSKGDRAVDYWDWLQDEIDNAGDNAVIELPDNVMNTENGDRIKVSGNKTITIDLKGKTIDRCRDSSDSDGHVFEVMNGATLTIRDSAGGGKITGGWATHGGGINIQEGSKFIFEGGTISGNHAEDGGGVYVRGTFKMTGGSIQDNTASVDGGGVFVADTGCVHMERITISGNKADDDGGGIYMHLKDDAAISGCNIKNNEAGDCGGGIYMDAADKTLTLNSDGPDFHTRIDNNSSSDDGAGIYLFRGTIDMTNGSVSGNTTDNDGGGVKITKNTKFTASGVKISQNQAKSEEGGGVKTFGETTLTNCTIAGNSAKKQGGGIFNDDSDGSGGDLTLDSCTISNNSTESSGGGIYSDKKLTIKGSTVIGRSTAGAGNYAAGKGCGVYIGADSGTTYIEGKPVVQDNIRSANGQEMYLNGGRKLTLSGELTEGAKIGVTINNGLGTFTTNYNTYNSGSEPSSFFFSPDGLEVIKDADGEAKLASSWPDLQAMIDEKPDGGTITLDHNYTATSGNDRLKIQGKSITIDLNGFTLNRNLTSEKSDGHVIEVFDNASLTVKDSSASGDDPGTGKITGGYSAHGGGIYVNKKASLTIESGTITANNADEDGGGIYVRGTLNMTGGSVTNNKADVDGGGIFVTADGSIDLKDAEIDGNVAEDDGGGLYLHLASDSSVSGCKITGNQSDDLGGGINLDAKGKTLTIDKSSKNNTKIESNRSSDDGAGIYLYRGTIDMTGGSLSDNISSNDSGGIKTTKNTVFNAQRVTISGNKANSEEGGGVKNQGTSTLTGCTVSGNSAKKEGGGIFNDDTDDSQGDLTIDGCTIYDNSTDSNGGGIYSDHKLTLKGTNTIGKATISGTTYPGNTADGKGAGIYIGKDAKYTNIQGSLKMKDNTAVIGKDIYLREDQILTLTGAITGTNIGSIDMQELGVFTKNYSTNHSGTAPVTFFNTDRTMDVELTSDGKEVQIRSAWPDLQTLIDEKEAGGTLTLTRSYIADYDDDSLEIAKDITIDLAGYTLDRCCIHKRDNCHVIEVTGTAKLTIKDSSASGNDPGTGKITGGWAKNGGGIYVDKNATLKIEGGTVSGCNAKTDGGGIYVAGNLIMTGGAITDNYADDTGGGIYVSSDGTIDLKNAKIKNNTADNTGGGINMHLKGDSSIENCTISDNSVVDDVGGGIRVDAKGKTLTIKNSNIDNNYSVDDGAGIYLKYGTIEMDGGTISGNTCLNDGGGIKVTQSTTFNATGVTISNNASTTEEGGGIKNLGTTSLKNCTVAGNTAKKQGGGIFNDDSDGSAGDLTIEGCTISANKASDTGGGIYSDYKLTIKGKNVIGAATVGENKYAGNSSKERGGGIFVGKDSKFVKIEGELIVKDNTADIYGDNMFFNGDQILTVTGALINADNKAQIHVDISGGTGTLTKDYAKHNKTEGGAVIAPDKYFAPAKGYNVALNSDNETKITSDWGTLKDQIESYTGSAPITLEYDYAAAPGDDRIEIPKDKNITIDLNGHTLNRNRMSKNSDGHVIEVFGTLTLMDSSDDQTGTITGGWANNGGGINISDEGTLNFKGGTVTGNKSGEDGGGIYVHGTLNMTGGRITGNTADEDGGGICLDEDSTLVLSGGSITGNTADEEAGGIFVDGEAVAEVSGSPAVDHNSAMTGYNIYLEEENRLTVTGPFGESASMGVAVESDSAELPFTTGYGTNNAGKAPALYFTSNDGYEVCLKAGEAAFRIPKEDGTQFIPKNSQIQTDINQLSSQNWMTGISGERRLNEINLPGSHDSGMRSLYHWSTSVYNLGAIGASYAYTQRRYIDEQMEDGIRKFDVRLNPYYLGKGVGGAFRFDWDDGENCWLAHGKSTVGGTYYAKDHDGSQLSLNNVLEYTKDFLRKHPTEVINLNFSPECSCTVRKQATENKR